MTSLFSALHCLQLWVFFHCFLYLGFQVDEWWCDIVLKFVVKLRKLRRGTVCLYYANRKLLFCFLNPTQCSIAKSVTTGSVPWSILDRQWNWRGQLILFSINLEFSYSTFGIYCLQSLVRHLLEAIKTSPHTSVIMWNMKCEMAFLFGAVGTSLTADHHHLTIPVKRRTCTYACLALTDSNQVVLGFPMWPSMTAVSLNMAINHDFCNVLVKILKLWLLCIFWISWVQLDRTDLSGDIQFLC